MRSQKRLHYGFHLSDDPLVLLKHEKQLVIIGLELVLLQQNDSCRLRNLYSHSVHAFCLPD